MKPNILSVHSSSWCKKPVWAGLCAVLLLGTTPLRAQQRQALSGHVPAITTRLQPLGRVDGATNLSLAIGLPLRNKEALTNLLREMYDPASTNYHRYLTTGQFTEQFGPTEEDYAALRAFAGANGLTVTRLHPNRTLLDVKGPVADIEKAFHVTMRLYQHPKEARTFYAPDAEPSINLAVPILYISGLNNYTIPHPLIRTNLAMGSHKPLAFTGSGPGGNFMGKDFRAAYVPGASLTGTGQTVGMLELDGYLGSDIALYEGLAGLPNVPLQNVLLDGFNGLPSGTGGEVEVSLDIEMAVSMAPGLSSIIVYEAPNAGPSEDDILNQMATDDIAKQISSSWSSQLGDPLADQIYQQFAMQGQSFFQASGDAGAYAPGNDEVQESPYITLVGGTTLTTTGPVGAWSSETVWNTGTDAGGGGGISTVYSLPVWQQGISMTANQGSTTFRNIPDVALTADNVFVIADSGTEMQDIGGTSCAAPLWAAFTALMNQQAVNTAQPPLGFLNPAIYAIGKGAIYGTAFHDIVTGNNTNSLSPTLFFAVPGYDLCAGWGTPAGTNLINILVPPATAPNFVVLTNVVSGGNGNGIIDPNECNSFDLILANVGSAGATGVHATLSTSTKFVAVTQPNSDYSDLPAGAASTNLTHFTVSTSSNLFCGRQINFTLVVKSDQVTRTIEFSVQTGCTDGGGRCPGIDVGVAMTASPGAVIVNSNLTYTVTVINNGPDTARGVTMSQTLPTNVIFQSGSSTQGSVTSSAGLVGASLGDLNVGATATITVVANPTVVGTISSTATVGSLDPDFNPANNSATVVTQVKPPTADLAVTLTASPNPVSIGGILTYTVAVTNNGPVAAVNTVLTDVLPANVSFVSAIPSQGNALPAGNQVVCDFGTLPVGGLATVTIQVRAIAVGGITDTASVSSDISDPVPGNNTASVSTTIAPSSDLAMTMTGSPAAAVIGNNVTYVVTVLNQGPSPATDVTILDTTASNLTYQSMIATRGTVTRTGNVVRCAVPSLPVGSSVTLTIVVGTANLPTDYSTPQIITNSAIVSSGTADPNLANNSASVTTRVDIARPTVVAAGAGLVAESFAPANGFVDPGETVTVSLRLQNIGTSNTGNLVATLLATNGVTPAGSQVQSYGAIVAGGAPVTNLFTFTAATNGVGVTATLQLQDGSTNLGLVQFVFPFPAMTTFSNTVNIAIPDHGEASPYPSSINVAGVTGLISKVTVTVTNFNHTFPDDVDMLLVGPAGQSVVLMSHAGDEVATNISLTFDQGAATMLPQTGQIASGSYQPSAYNLGSVLFPASTSPAANPPPMPYGTNLSNFNGTNANGTWSLYVFDSSPGDQGVILGGWQLAISAGTPVALGGDVAITGVAAPNPVLAGGNLTYTFSVTNDGPGLADVVTFTDVLPAGVSFVTGSNSLGTAMTTNGSGAVTSVLGSLGTGTNVTVTMVVTPTISGTLTNAATIATADQELNQANNSVTLLTTVNAQIADLAVSVSSTPSPAVLGGNLAYVLTVTNSGPGAALGVVVTSTLNGVGTNANSPPFAAAGGLATNLVGTLAAGTAATVVLNVTPTQLGSVTNIASVATLSSDPNPANNAVASTITVIVPSPNIVGAGTRLLAESFSPPNGAIDSGETVTVSFTLTNSGSAGTSNVVATLLAINGVTPTGSPVQSYGALTPGGSAASRNFTFIGNGVNGGLIAATLQLQDGTNNLGTAVFNFNLPATTSTASGGGITIPDHGPGSPYPSTLTISGISGVISKATVTLSNLSHSFPNDIQVLLVGPSGQATVLMAGTGGAFAVTNATLTFDDAAAALLPSSGQIVSGTNKPTDYGLALPFPGPAPAGPYSPALAIFDGSVPNGTWSLYVFDNSPGDNGNVAGGWALNLTTVSPVNGAADLGVTLAGPAGVVLAGGNFTYTVGVTNKGPAMATDVTVTNDLPPGVNLVSTTAAGYSPFAGGVVFNLANLNPGGATNFTVTANAPLSGTYNSLVSVGADETDLFLSDNAAQVTIQVTVFVPPTLSAVAYTNGTFTLRLTGQPGVLYVIEASTDLNTWTPVSTNTSVNGIILFNDFNAGTFPLRFYRARLGP